MVNKISLSIFALSAALVLVIAFPLNAMARTSNVSNCSDASGASNAANAAVHVSSTNKEAINVPDGCVSLSELIDEAKDYDGHVINFRGEAIGNILYRGSYAWVNVSDADNSAIGIWMSADDARKISFLGHYGMRGDTLFVTGTFNRACPDHGGDPDIHADTVTIINSGSKTDISLPSYLPYLTVISAVCAVILCAFAFSRIRHYNA